MQTSIGNNLMETKIHGTRDLPFVIYESTFLIHSIQYISCHWHKEIEIVYCPKGNIDYAVNDKSFTLNNSNLMITNSNTLHQANMIDEAKWYAIVFDPKFLYGFEESRIKSEIFDNIAFNNLLINNNIIINKVIALINTYFKNTTFKSLKLLNQLSDLYLSILNEAETNDEVKYSQTSSHSVRLKQILDYINNNYKSKITIDDISKEIGLCRSEVCKLFKSELNTSIADYILKYRIEKSIPLLLSNMLNITEIANQCGFNSSSYYAEAFKKLTGMTPLEYKKNNKK